MEENTVAKVGVATPTETSTPPQTATQEPPVTTAPQVAEPKPATQTENVDRLDKHPRFKQVISEKNEARERARQLEAELADYKRRFAPPPAQETDPFAELPPEEREQTRQFINKFVTPSIKNELLRELQPVIQEVQTEKLNKQVSEAKTLASKFGIDFEERLPDIVDYLSRPENKGRLTAKEAFISLYSDEMFDISQNKAKEAISRENEELLAKKKMANTALPQVNPNTVIHSDEAALRNMSAQERIQHNIRKALEVTKQGVKSPKVTFE